MALAATLSKTWTFFDGDWHEGNVPIMGARTHAAWLGSSVFDGARAFEGVTPDLDLHCARVNHSAQGAVTSKPVVPAEQWVGLAAEGMKRFAHDTALYIRPMYWAEHGGALLVAPDPDSTRWCLTLYEAPMRPPEGFSITLSRFRRPTPETMPLDAKAGCLYPNNARALIEAQARGFHNASCATCWATSPSSPPPTSSWARTASCSRRVPNGTFLNGITRQRVIGLLREAGVTVVETTLRYQDFETADEIFSTGNYSKVMPVIRIDERSLQPGPLYRKARELYWEFAHA